MNERIFQRELIRRLQAMFPGCVILKNDPGYQQGVPDLIILFEDKWAMLEVKAFAEATEQPNQSYFVELLNGMSFAAFIYPAIEEEVLYALQQTFRPSRTTRISKRK